MPRKYRESVEIFLDLEADVEHGSDSATEYESIFVDSEDEDYYYGSGYESESDEGYDDDSEWEDDESDDDYYYDEDDDDEYDGSTVTESETSSDSMGENNIDITKRGRLYQKKNNIKTYVKDNKTKNGLYTVPFQHKLKSNKPVHVKKIDVSSSDE